MLPTPLLYNSNFLRWFFYLSRCLGCDFVCPDIKQTGLQGVLWPYFPVGSSYPDFVRTDRPRFLLNPVQFPVGPKILAGQSALFDIFVTNSYVIILFYRSVRSCILQSPNRNSEDFVRSIKSLCCCSVLQSHSLTYGAPNPTTKTSFSRDTQSLCERRGLLAFCSRDQTNHQKGR